jgi:hypothetical protein
LSNSTVQLGLQGITSLAGLGNTQSGVGVPVPANILQYIQGSHQVGSHDSEFSSGFSGVDSQGHVVVRLEQLLDMNAQVK